MSVIFPFHVTRILYFISTAQTVFSFLIATFTSPLKLSFQEKLGFSLIMEMHPFANLMSSA